VLHIFGVVLLFWGVVLYGLLCKYFWGCVAWASILIFLGFCCMVFYVNIFGVVLYISGVELHGLLCK
jgi:hypothetical protein